MQIKDIMTKKAITAKPDTPINEVAHILRDNKIHGVPIVEDNKVIGIVVENDFFSKSSIAVHLPSYIDLIKKTPIAGEISNDQKEKINKLINIKARDIMTSPCLCLSPWMNVEEAIRIFKETQLITFPVVDDNRNLIGVVTLADVLNLF